MITLLPTKSNLILLEDSHIQIAKQMMLKQKCYYYYLIWC